MGHAGRVRSQDAEVGVETFFNQQCWRSNRDSLRTKLLDFADVHALYIDRTSWCDRTPFFHAARPRKAGNHVAHLFGRHGGSVLRNMRGHWKANLADSPRRTAAAS